MGIKKWLGEKLLGLNHRAPERECLCVDLQADLYFRILAFRTAVSMIARSVSKCAFRTYAGGKEVEGDEWYVWNVEPNKNENSSQFLTACIETLYTQNEVLILDIGGQLLRAESFTATP